MDTGPLLLSFQIAVVATLVAGVVGLFVASLLASFRFRGREIVDVLFSAPLVLPPTVLGYFLLVAIGRKSTIGHAYEALTGSSIVFTKAGAVCAAAVGALPFVVRFARSALEGVDPVYVQAARTLGATPLRAFFRVQLPLAKRGIIAALTLAFARSLGDFGITLMVAGNIPGETRTAALAIYDAIQAQRESDARAMVLVLTATALSALYVVGKLLRARESES